MNTKLGSTRGWRITDGGRLIRKFAAVLVVVVVGSMVAPIGGVTPAVASADNTANTALSATYGADRSLNVERPAPRFPTCTNGTSYNNMTVTGNGNPVSEARGFGIAGRDRVDLNNPDPAVSNIGPAFLKLFPSGFNSQPWGIAMYQASSNLEIRWNGSQWVLPGESNYNTAQRFTDAGQAYGLYGGGFLHASSFTDWGTFLLIGQSFPGSNRIDYTPVETSNVCDSGLAIVVGASLSPSETTLTMQLNAAITPITFTRAGFGSGAITYSISPALPAGLAFDVSTGEITGTPTAAISWSGYTITALEAGVPSASAIINMTVVTTPSAPTIDSATPGNGSASIAFTAPADNGGATITNYEYSIDGGANWITRSPADTNSPLAITGLTNGTTYSVALRAVNSVGAGTASTTSNVTPGPVAPAAPAITTGTPGNESASIAFTAPADDGGAAITNYEYSIDDGFNWITRSPANTSSPILITGLTNGTEYEIRIRAVNSVGEGTQSNLRRVTPAPALPTAPTITSATPGDGSALIAFTAPGSDGGAAITNYEYQLDGGAWVAMNPASTTSPLTIPGLTNGQTYSVKLRAVNSAGGGAESTAVTVTPSDPTPPLVFPPSAPLGVIGTAGDASAVVNWSAPADSGSFPISNYRVSAAPGGASCLAAAPSLTCMVSGLANGQPYTFTVEALNGAGWGPASAASNAVVPGGVTPAPAPEPLPAPVPLGDHLLQVAGVVDPNVDVQPNPTMNGLNIEGDNWTMELDGLGPDGKPLDLGPNNSLRLAIENKVVTEGTGFLPNSDVDLYINPPVATQGSSVRTQTTEAIYVGTVKTNARGVFSGTATLPEDLPAGEHVLQAVGYSPTFKARAMSLGVSVDAWIVLDQGTRKANGVHDRIISGGTSEGIPAGARLTPYIRYSGQRTFHQGKATITITADGTFRWTRKIKTTRGLTAYVTYQDINSNRVFWAKVR